MPLRGKEKLHGIGGMVFGGAGIGGFYSISIKTGERMVAQYLGTRYSGSRYWGFYSILYSMIIYISISETYLDVCYMTIETLSIVEITYYCVSEEII